MSPNSSIREIGISGGMGGKKGYPPIGEDGATAMGDAPIGETGAVTPGTVGIVDPGAVAVGMAPIGDVGVVAVKLAGGKTVVLMSIGGVMPRPIPRRGEDL